MSKREPKLLTEDIIDSANKIPEYTQDLSFEAFTNDSKTIDAVIRNFEIIGEAANRLPDNYKDAHLNIDYIAFVDLEIEMFMIISVLTIR